MVHLSGNSFTTAGDTARELPQIVKELRTSGSNKDTLQRVTSLITGFKSLETPGGNEKDEEWFRELYSKEQYPSVERDLLFDKIEQNNSRIRQEFMEILDIQSYSNGPLFESPGAIVSINTDGIIQESLFSPQNELLVGSSSRTQSQVSEQYDHNTLRRMAFEKAIFQLYLSIISGNEEGQELDTKEAQESTTEILRTQYYRGGYFDGTISYGVTACTLSEHVVHEILNKNGFPDQKLEEIAKKLGCHAGKVDLLASIGDELFARILSSGVNDITRHIKVVAEIILEKAQVGKIEELC